MNRVHVVGGGMAGLAAALRLSDAGRPVTLYEAGPAPGGRCRSFHDRELGCVIDNGNHLWLSGNPAIAAFIARVGSQDTLAGPAEAAFPFVDLATGARWTVRPNRGRIPWWVLSRRRRVPGTGLRDYLALLALLRAGPGATVGDVLAPTALFRRLLEPLVIAVLNTPAATGSAALMAAVVRETLAQGGAACVPAFGRDGLSATFVDPAVQALATAGATLHTGRRIAGLSVTDGTVTALAGPDGTVPVAPGEAVVLAVPAPVAQALVPGTSAPDEFESIVNIHYRAKPPPGSDTFVGLLGGVAEWVFAKREILSVTISAANRLGERSQSDLAATVWPEICTAFGMTQPLPPWRVVREKRATFAATPDQDRKRPPTRTGLANLALAGDWTATGLPATIEGAIRSGHKAADAVLSA